MYPQNHPHCRAQLTKSLEPKWLCRCHGIPKLDVEKLPKKGLDPSVSDLPRQQQRLFVSLQRLLILLIRTERRGVVGQQGDLE